MGVKKLLFHCVTLLFVSWELLPCNCTITRGVALFIPYMFVFIFKRLLRAHWSQTVRRVWCAIRDHVPWQRNDYNAWSINNEKQRGCILVTPLSFSSCSRKHDKFSSLVLGREQHRSMVRTLFNSSCWVFVW